MRMPLLTFLACVCLASAADQPAARVTASATNTFRITGMSCAGCAGGLEAEFRLTPGVARAKVTLTNATAVVAFDTNRITTTKLLKVIEVAGFKGALVKP